MVHDYIRINKIELEHGLCVEEYYSKRSGLRIILNKINSPKIYGYFTLLTEAENDEGLPHTLEHLIFLGSNLYPYKGFLDALAYKCLSEGTNAWTSIDHTCYTIETIGIEGFSNILPIYLDFILNPTLEDNMFLSEVHHFSEEGHNGVVYSEMKSIEHDCDNIVERTLLNNLYPNKKSGYRFETGGTLDGLRKTNNNRVKEYFKKFYKFNNFAAIIFGNFDNNKILNIIYEFETYQLNLHPDQAKQNYNSLILENKISDQININKINDINIFLQDIQNINRPWNNKENVEKRDKSHIVKKYYPCNNLDNGQVSIAWRGCNWNDFKTKLAINLFGNYLTDLTTSPISKKLLEDKENTFCSNIDFSIEDLKENYFVIDIYDVVHKFKESKNDKKEDKTEEMNEKKQNVENKSKMEIVGEITRKCIQEVFDNPLNMTRLKNIIIRSYLQHLKDLETIPQYLLIELIIKYFIYGKSVTDLENSLNLKNIYLELLEEQELYWKNLIEVYFLKNPYVEVRCYPSYKKAKEIERFEKELIKKEQDKYGIDKLNEMIKQINEIKEGIKKKPPQDALNIVDFSKAKNVIIDGITVFRNFESVERSEKDEKNEKNEILTKIDENMKKVIFPVQLSQIESNFVSLNLLINCNNIDNELKKYLPLFSYLIFETDVEINNEIVKCEHFLEELIKYSISYDCNYSLGGNAKGFKSGCLGNLLCIQIVGLIENYEKLFDLLFLSIFKINLSLERLEVILKSEYQNLLQKKTQPKTLISNLEYVLRYSQNSNAGIISIGQQELILQKIKDKNNLEDLLLKLNILKNQLFKLTNFVLTIDANFFKISNIFSWYDKWFTNLDKTNYFVKFPYIDIFDFVKNQESFSKSSSSKYLCTKGQYANFSENNNSENNNCRSATASTNNTEEALCSTSKSKKYISFGTCVHKNLFEYLNIEFEKENKDYNKNVINDKVYNAVICGIKSTDVSYLNLTVKTEPGYKSEEYSCLLILREFFSMTEGPLYNTIRGGGYAYECALNYNPILGEITLRIYRSSDIVNALIEALKILEYYCQHEMKENELHLSKNSAYYTIFSNQEVASDRASQTVYLSLKNLDLNFYQHLLVDIESVTTSQLLRICKKYISKIVNFKIDKNNAIDGSTLSIITSAEKVELIKSNLKDRINFGVINNLSISQLFHLLQTYDINSAAHYSPNIYNSIDNEFIENSQNDENKIDEYFSNSESCFQGNQSSYSSSSSDFSFCYDDDSYPGYSDV
ncbi:insulinase, putative [Plasmodium berghei]|uniref:Insulinase, putative n=2 Tax=Plasmodium berghei TaxID=5821 RepID=A0A509AIV0_PLABA|nr:insulinase, putative [Plasmodium berghei ANKA]CXI44272.1 insulinase, putative [Plasmodium berghei]SCM22482.1 insulinase, putative [Plasmodium berghei]SCN25473.1 insulinase, putative [Plasmodium berghei]SCO60437.1 insulinase, putative [Plasmodium berghei]SCO62234.1 insulinase, putative [Plasmodium berghei]|eukprot:XP_034421648.1 insulinase, putative [Plasmodium berghei ANKA]